VTPRREWLWVSGAVLLILLINLLTASRSPTVWQDEVMFAEPAANVILGRGLTSNAWPKYTPTALWAGNAPLHTWLLVPWLWVWGLTPAAVRAVNFVYVGIAAMLLWWAVRRSRMIESPLPRVALVVLLLCENAVVFSYRSGRYDAIGVLLLGAAAAAVAADAPALALVLIGIPIPFAGLQLLPYAAVVGVVLLVVFGLRSLRITLPLGFGAAVGCVLLYAVFRSLGAWDAFVLAVRGWRADAGLGSAIAEYPKVLATDPSLLLALVVLLMGVRRSGVLSLFLLAAVPVALGISGRFPRYYLWMLAIPMLVAAVQSWQKTRFRKIGAALLIAGALAGLPARLALAAVEWHRRDYTPVEELIARSVRPADVVVADWQAFYGLYRVRAHAYYPARQLSADEKAAITKLVIAPEDFARVSAMIGGAWRDVDGLLAAKGLNAKLYSLHVYARE
jgi:hypothetical protein